MTETTVHTTKNISILNSIMYKPGPNLYLVTHYQEKTTQKRQRNNRYKIKYKHHQSYNKHTYMYVHQ